MMDVNDLIEYLRYNNLMWHVVEKTIKIMVAKEDG